MQSFQEKNGCQEYSRKINPLPPKSEILDFTPSNARRFLPVNGDHLRNQCIKNLDTHSKTTSIAS